MSEEKAKLSAEVKQLEGALVAAKSRLYGRPENKPVDSKELEGWSWAIWAFLLASVLAGAVWATVVLRSWSTVPLREFSLAAAVGVLGAGLSGLMSLNDRVANGWEFEDGSREPDPAEKKERFNLRMSRGFLARPFLGVASGPLVLAGINLGQIVQASQSGGTDERYRIVFFCLLGGLFSKTLFDWLKDAFKKLLGK